MELKFQVQLKIRKPARQAFDAVVDPKKLSGYFLQTSTGPLAPGATVMWKFAEVLDPFPVSVHEVVADERIVLEWPSAIGGGANRVEMAFKAIDADNTLVQISESGWPQTAEGVSASQANAGGWMHMMACMKAYLEYGINLREGGAR